MVTIKKATQAQTIAAIKSGDFSVIDTINKKARKEATEIFMAVAGGVIKLAYWDMSPVKRRDGKKSVMRYALHRSTKKEDCLQLSCMELIGGEIIPTSDRQFNIKDDYDRREFFRSLPSVTKMTLKYQNLTYGIVWNSLIRKLNAILTSSPKSLSGGGKKV